MYWNEEGDQVSTFFSFQDRINQPNKWTQTIAPHLVVSGYIIYQHNLELVFAKGLVTLPLSSSLRHAAPDTCSKETACRKNNRLSYFPSDSWIISEESMRTRHQDLVIAALYDVLEASLKFPVQSRRPSVTGKHKVSQAGNPSNSISFSDRLQKT